MAYGDELNPKQLLFCQEYVVDLNATQAAIRAGYSPRTAESQASTLLRVPKVKAKVQSLMDKRAKRIEVTSDMVLQRIWDIANIDLADAYDNTTGALLLVKNMPESIRKTLVGIDTYKDFTEGVNIGETQKIKISDRLKALELYGRHKKLFVDKVEISGTLSIAEEISKARQRARGK